ncbi:MAG: hypothetical protein WKF81_08465 [Thermomicrobiales bacterium]
MESSKPVTTDAPPEDQHVYLSHEQILVVIVGLLAGMMLAALDQSIATLPSRRSSATWVD